MFYILSTKIQFLSVRYFSTFYISIPISQILAFQKMRTPFYFSKLLHNLKKLIAFAGRFFIFIATVFNTAVIWLWV